MRTLRAALIAFSLVAVMITPVFADSGRYNVSGNVKVTGLGGAGLVSGKISLTASANWDSNPKSVSFSDISATEGTTPNPTISSTQTWDSGFLWFAGTRKLITTYKWNISQSILCKGTVTAVLVIAIRTDGDHYGTRDISTSGCAGITAKFI